MPISARANSKTVLVSFDGQTETHPLFDVPLSYEPQEAAHNLWVMRVDAFAAIREYVRRKVPFSGMYDTFLKSRMFRDFAEAAPGFEELMCLGKLYDLATDSAFSKVVFDAPATGHLKTLIDVPAATLQGRAGRSAQPQCPQDPGSADESGADPGCADHARRRDGRAGSARAGGVSQERRMGVGPMIVNQRVCPVRSR